MVDGCAHCAVAVVVSRCCPHRHRRHPCRPRHRRHRRRRRRRHCRRPRRRRRRCRRVAVVAVVAIVVVIIVVAHQAPYPDLLSRSHSSFLFDCCVYKARPCSQRILMMPLIGLFQVESANPSVADFQEGGGDPILDLVANELEFLTLGDDYVEDMSEDVADGIMGVADGIEVAADGEAMSPIRNLGKRLVLLQRLFDDFEGNINWEDDEDEEDEDDANGTVEQSDSSHHRFSDGHSLADEEEAYRK